jgi:hypothetical protein
MEAENRCRFKSCRGMLNRCQIVMILGIAFSFAESASMEHSKSATATCQAETKVNGLAFVHTALRCKRLHRAVLSKPCITATSQGEDRPAQVAEIRSAARDALKSLLGKALDTAVANSARSSAIQQPVALNIASVAPQRIRIGFVGTGTITTAVVTGLCGAEDASDLQITVSPRNQEKAAALRALYPAQVTIGKDNQEVLDRSDIVCIAVTPAQAPQTLSALRCAASPRFYGRWLRVVT